MGTPCQLLYRFIPLVLISFSVCLVLFPFHFSFFVVPSFTFKCNLFCNCVESEELLDWLPWFTVHQPVCASDTVGANPFKVNV